MLYGDERRKTHPGTILYNGVVPAFSPGPGFLSDLSKKNTVNFWSNVYCNNMEYCSWNKHKL